MNITPFEQLMKLAKVATGVNLRDDCTYEVSVSNYGDEIRLGIQVHNPPAAFIEEAVVKHGASTDGWVDCSSSGSPENVYRTWKFEPEKGMFFTIFERAPTGKLLGDLPYEETREAIRARRKAEVAA